MTRYRQSTRGEVEIEAATEEQERMSESIRRYNEAKKRVMAEMYTTTADENGDNVTKEISDEGKIMDEYARAVKEAEEKRKKAQELDTESLSEEYDKSMENYKMLKWKRNNLAIARENLYAEDDDATKAAIAKIEKAKKETSDPDKIAEYDSQIAEAREEAARKRIEEYEKYDRELAEEESQEQTLKRKLESYLTAQKNLQDIQSQIDAISGDHALGFEGFSQIDTSWYLDPEARRNS